jgi:hypothetical protein
VVLQKCNFARVWRNATCSPQSYTTPSGIEVKGERLPEEEDDEEKEKDLEIHDLNWKT